MIETDDHRCHCGKPLTNHDDEHPGKCCDCFDSEVLGSAFAHDPGYCSECDG